MGKGVVENLVSFFNVVFSYCICLLNTRPKNCAACNICVLPWPNGLSRGRRNFMYKQCEGSTLDVGRSTSLPSPSPPCGGSANR